MPLPPPDTAPADALAAQEAARLAARAAAVPLPPPLLDGWSSPAASEYAEAAAALRLHAARAVEALHRSAAP